MSRQEKVREALKKEVSIILHDELNDPRLGFITITDAKVSPDLRQVKIFFSVLGKEEDYKKTREALDSALGFIRRLIAQRVRLRFAPEIIFKEDRSSEYSIRIQEVLNQISELNNPLLSNTRKAVQKKRGKSGAKKGSRLPKKI